ncbi:OmpA family protein [Myroides sp. LoEW2-1]|nr:OmpA family protein [Myroides sp. LoEW2-1]MVX36546.1 OmpA family protein [Myroides sp. LoEW2-1]
MLSVNTTFGQSKKELARVNKQIERLAFADAIDSYEKLVKKGKASQEVVLGLANAYYENGLYIEANHWFEEAFGKIESSQEIEDLNNYYRYVQTVRTLGDYTVANAKMDLLADKFPEDGRIKKYLADPNYITEVNSNREGYKVKLLNSVNTEFSEYGSALYKGEIVYASSQKSKFRKDKIHSWTNDPYTKLFSAPVRIDGYIGEVKPFAKKLDGNFNEANAVFSADQRAMYFSSNTRGDKNTRYSDGTMLVSLYRAYSFGQGKWGDVEKLSINVPHANSSQPALSPDQDWLYFSSDRPGGYGQSDLYRVKLYRDGTFGVPENLGDKINTEGRESFPFVSSDNVLYFASDGHPGLGGLDLYGVQIYEDGTFGEVVNLGNSINSSHDDFAMYLDPESKFGFITSNRPNGEGKDDLYFVRMKLGTELNVAQEIRGKVVDQATDKPIWDAFVFLYDEKHRLIDQIEVDKRGEYKFTDVKINREYSIAAKAPGYNSAETAIDPVTKNVDIVVDFALNRSKELVIPGYEYGGTTGYGDDVRVKEGDDLTKVLNLQPIYFDLDKFNIRLDAQIELSKVASLMLNYPQLKLEVRSHTDATGPDAYNMRLSERRAISTVDWLVKQGISRNRIKGIGMGESQIMNHCKNNVPCSEREHQKNRRSEFIVIGL